MVASGTGQGVDVDIGVGAGVGVMLAISEGVASAVFVTSAGMLVGDRLAGSVLVGTAGSVMQPAKNRRLRKEMLLRMIAIVHQAPIPV